MLFSWWVAATGPASHTPGQPHCHLLVPTQYSKPFTEGTLPTHLYRCVVPRGPTCRDGVGTAALSRAIKDAAAAGVKVGEARRLLKLMQARAARRLDCSCSVQDTAVMCSLPG